MLDPDIENLKPGVDLDIIVSKEIMGWRICPSDFMPSQTIGAAWEVVLHMGNKKGFHAHLRTPFVHGEPFSAGFTPRGCTGFNGRPDFDAMAETMPLAICRAALKALLATKDEL